MKYFRTTNTKYLKKINTDYLVRFVVILRKSRAQVDGQQAIHDAPRKDPIQTEPGRGQNFLSVSRISKIFELRIVTFSCSALNGT